MKHIPFGTANSSIAILIKNSALHKVHLQNYYITPTGLPSKEFIAFGLKYDLSDKIKVSTVRSHLAEILPILDKLGINTILCCDSHYYKVLVKKTKSETDYGNVLPCGIAGYEHFNVLLSPNYAALKYNPTIKTKLDLAVESLRTFIKGTYTPVGENIIHYAEYPQTASEIAKALSKLYSIKELTCDIETRGLDFWNCGIATISFAWNKHEGIAFAVDRNTNITEIPLIRQHLRAFLQTYRYKLYYHNTGFDAKVLIFNLFMTDLSDYVGMLEGLHTLTRSFEDTKIITYLATNNAHKNTLDLKSLALPFAGDYGLNVKNTDLISLDKLLEYNLKDCLATWYVYEVYYPQMVNDQQKQIYEELMKPSIKTLLQMELCGLPIDPKKVLHAEQVLTAVATQAHTYMQNSQIIQNSHYDYLQIQANQKTAKAKKKIYVPEDSVIWCEFNPDSSKQLQHLLYAHLGLPVISVTKTRQPSTDISTLIALKNRTTDTDTLAILDSLIQLSEVSVLLSTFIPAFKKAQQLPNSEWRLYGNFNLGGTQSLRLSSSHPNLQNIPSNSKYAKLIKACFISTFKWIYAGSDFDALEDKTNALLTQDPNKVKVYTDGFDGHCLRAYSYFTDHMPDINPKSVTSINSIKTKYPKERQDSKAPTFALQYQGTSYTLVKNCGFLPEKAKEIEKKYHQLYKVADKWIANLIDKAKSRGWIPLAFDGRIRTPLLATSGTKLSTSAQKEARSAGNAATQSYCVLTLRALNEFMERVWSSPYKYKILPSGTIHDAGYFLIANEIETAEFVNINLIECMAWQNLPELQHPTIKLSSSLELFWPDWAHAIEIPNKAPRSEMRRLCR